MVEEVTDEIIVDSRSKLSGVMAVGADTTKRSDRATAGEPCSTSPRRRCATVSPVNAPAAAVPAGMVTLRWSDSIVLNGQSFSQPTQIREVSRDDDHRAPCHQR